MCDHNVIIKEEKFYSVKGKAGMRYEEPKMEIILFESEQVRTDIIIDSKHNTVPNDGTTWGPPF